MLEAGQLPIAAGGGGIPVAMQNGQYRGMSAVIDKDFSAAKLAELIGADTLIILTAVEKVAVNFGKPDQKWLDTLTVADAAKYMGENQFAKGSMLPKVQAAVGFVQSGDNRKALITLLAKAKEGIEGKTGTVITKE
jgi:carbamate kinase